jgi:hypothetical protein
MTDWRDVGDGVYQGSGLRLFLVDGDEKALLEVRKLEINSQRLEEDLSDSLDPVENEVQAEDDQANV